MTFTQTITTLTLVLALSSCAGTKKKPKQSEFGQTLEQRTSSTYKSLLNNDNSKRSSFEKQAQIAKSKNVKTKAFSTKNFTSGKTFSEGDHKFKTNNFSQADKKSRAADQSYSDGEKQSRLGSENYHTSQSRFDGQTNRDSNKISPLANDTFRTSEYREGMKSIKENKRPLIDSKDKYTEDEIQKILNK